MSIARFKVRFAGPLVSVQDAGRLGHLRFGVSSSGPMDRFAFAAAHALLANTSQAQAIEVSLGGLQLECTEGTTTIAVAGGAFNVTCGGTTTNEWGVFTVSQGDKISIRGGDWGSWCYLAFAGNMRSSEWLGSASTHSMSGFGGGTLTAGLDIEVSNTQVRETRVGTLACPSWAKPNTRFRAVLGPQDQHFSPASVTQFFEQTYAVTDAFDRMGARLAGPTLTLNNALSIPSEPIIRGSVQVSGDGIPTVLLADHQTTGGYPKIATLLSCDTDTFAQLRSGDAVQFQSVTNDTAVEIARENAHQQAQMLAEIAAPRKSLEEKLQSLNLIGGVVAGD